MQQKSCPIIAPALAAAAWNAEMPGMTFTAMREGSRSITSYTSAAMA